MGALYKNNQDFVVPKNNNVQLIYQCKIVLQRYIIMWEAGAWELQLQPPNPMIESSSLIISIIRVFVWIFVFRYKFSLFRFWKFPYELGFISYPLHLWGLSLFGLVNYRKNKKYIVEYLGVVKNDICIWISIAYWYCSRSKTSFQLLILKILNFKSYLLHNS